MALLHDDLYSNNIVDDPDDLDLLVEGRVEEEDETREQPVEEKDDEGKDKTDEEKGDKKKRRQVQRPRLNVLRLMDRKTGLTAAERMFKDVKFKGKGHELEDLNLVMKRMEIWAHKLYPSFDFDDCLHKLEKLGNTRSVSTYVKRLRMGLEDSTVAPQDGDNLVRDSSGADSPAEDPTDRFDQLMKTQPQSVPNQGGLTNEQRERMRRNRLMAEQRRMARLKAQQEKKENSANEVENTVSNQSESADFSAEQTVDNLQTPEDIFSGTQNSTNNDNPDVHSTYDLQLLPEKDSSENCQIETTSNGPYGNSHDPIEPEPSTSGTCNQMNNESSILSNSINLPGLSQDSADIFSPKEDDVEMREVS